MRRLLVLATVPVLMVMAPWTMAAPNITTVSLRGMQIGSTNTLVFEGTELLPDPIILASFPIAAQSVRPNSASNRVEIDVVAGEQTAPGIYQIRLASGKGVSNPIAVGLDRLAQKPFADRVDSLPIALHGNLSGTQILTTRFRGEKGSPFVADVEAQRLGSKLKPVLRLKDSQGRQLAWGSTAGRIAGDARIALALPEDGEYTVELHDVLYRAGVPGYFRLKLGELTFADLVFPLGVQTGTKAPLQFTSSNYPTHQLVELDASGLQRLSTIAAPTVGGSLFSGSTPRVVISAHPEVVETARPGERQELSGYPVAVSGRLERTGEEDQFVLPVAPGAKLHFEVQAQRLGSPLDGVLTVRSEQGKQLATNDDRPGTSDPGLDVTVPADVQKLIFALRDLVGRGGEEFVYRIAITDLGQPDVTIQADTDRLNIPAGATQTIRLQLTRSGYNGPIGLAIPGLPPGVEISGAQIPAQATVGLLTLTAPTSQPMHLLGSIIANGENSAFSRVVRAPENDTSKRLPWLRDEFAFSITEPAPVVVTWADAADAPLPLGSRLPLPVNLQRKDGVEGNVRLRLLTTQIMPRKKIKENNQAKEVDDVDRALRLDGEPSLGADVKHTEVNILVPADLAAQDWGLVIAADLMSGDNKTVVATTTTKVRHLRPIVPFSIELANVDQVEAKAGLGNTGQLTGKLRRRPGFTGPLTVTLRGLPTEYTAPSVTVPADKDEFVFDIRFPYGAKPGELKDAKLVAVFQPNPKIAELVVRSNEIALGAIKVVPGEAPPATHPLAVFEDDEKFVSMLSKGEGKISLETQDNYSGTSSVKVTPDQRYNEMVEGLNVKIRENPGPGEYRYLRFAWKKQGGASICIQINHDGTWGVGGSGKPGAKFRYHSGSGGECYGASLVVDEKLPSEFTVVTRDLFADFGEFIFTGLALSPVDGEFALFDHLYLGRNMADLDSIKTAK